MAISISIFVELMLSISLLSKFCYFINIDIFKIFLTISIFSKKRCQYFLSFTQNVCIDIVKNILIDIDILKNDLMDINFARPPLPQIAELLFSKSKPTLLSVSHGCCRVSAAVCLSDGSSTRSFLMKSFPASETCSKLGRSSV